jgi:hypothetical protein
LIGSWDADGQLKGCVVNYACHATTDKRHVRTGSTTLRRRSRACSTRALLSYFCRVSAAISHMWTTVACTGPVSVG